MKTEDETMPTKPVQDNYFSSGVNRKSNDLLKGTFKMKDEFEAAIRDKCRERLGRNNVVGIIKAAEVCNTLHQQAMKEEREKRRKAITSILEEWQLYIGNPFTDKIVRKIAIENNIEL